MPGSSQSRGHARARRARVATSHQETRRSRPRRHRRSGSPASCANRPGDAWRRSPPGAHRRRSQSVRRHVVERCSRPPATAARATSAFCVSIETGPYRGPAPRTTGTTRASSSSRSTGVGARTRRLSPHVDDVGAEREVARARARPPRRVASVREAGKNESGVTLTIAHHRRAQRHVDLR